ncbi:hypothetical protein [Taibaiella koreensis]|nr:hypothetical protein [Taibaiella koreensis]
MKKLPPFTSHVVAGLKQMQQITTGKQGKASASTSSTGYVLANVLG